METPKAPRLPATLVLSPSKSFFVGCDEVGYGSLAGPLVVGAVRAPRDWTLEGLNDSKQLSAKKREAMRPKLLELIDRKKISYHSAERSNTYIDKVGVALALKEAFVECFHALYDSESLIITDGNLKFDKLGVDAYDKVSLVKADTLVPAVMAASILAKTYRDGLMKEYHKQYPAYGWDDNAGYAAKAHYAGLEAFGPCALHRFSYAPMKLMPQPINLWPGKQ